MTESELKPLLLKKLKNDGKPDGKEFFGFRIELTLGSFPEQYDVYKGENKVGYVRLRGGWLTLEYPDCDFEEIYAHEFDDKYKGEFKDNEERAEYLTRILISLNARIQKGKPVRWSEERQYELYSRLHYPQSPPWAAEIGRIEEEFAEYRALSGRSDDEIEKFLAQEIRYGKGKHKSYKRNPDANLPKVAWVFGFQGLVRKYGIGLVRYLAKKQSAAIRSWMRSSSPYYSNGFYYSFEYFPDGYLRGSYSKLKDMVLENPDMTEDDVLAKLEKMGIR